jgi:predicted transcriptional regulator
VISDVKVPPAAPQIEEQEELNFRSIDGMYSYCTRDNGEVVHLVAWADVEVINK